MGAANILRADVSIRSNQMNIADVDAYESQAPLGGWVRRWWDMRPADVYYGRVEKALAQRRAIKARTMAERRRRCHARSTECMRSTSQKARGRLRSRLNGGKRLTRKEPECLIFGDDVRQK